MSFEIQSELRVDTSAAAWGRLAPVVLPISRRRVVLLALALQTHLGGLAMANDDMLSFKTHDLRVEIYSASDLNLVYAGSPHQLSPGELARDKTPQDDTKYWGGTSGSYVAFAGPVQLQWRSRDGVQHSYSLDLDEIFKDRRVLHSEDPLRIYKPMPITGGEPTIVIEVIDRTVNVYMFAALQLMPDDPKAVRRDEREHRTLAYSKTF
jgi:hypothetical protein